VYFQNIPTDPISDLSAIPYETAEDLGYFKIDFLHSSAYDYFKSRDEVTTLLKIDPKWELLQMPSVVQVLPQISKHLNVLTKLKPKSILELADVLALIRPGKHFLIDKYLTNKDYIRSKYLYEASNDQYAFKKAHAIAYAQMIVLHMHLIDMGIISC
jgi:hypothetical protein